MKAVILAGGLGSRLSEETTLRPKPMVEIGGKPILWHIMKTYACHGINEFIVALGYKAEVVKDYFLRFYAINNDLTIDLASGATTIHKNGHQTDWKVHLADTGLHTQTGGRLKRLQKWLANDETFLFTYGDGVTDLVVGNSEGFVLFFKNVGTDEAPRFVPGERLRAAGVLEGGQCLVGVGLQDDHVDVVFGGRAAPRPPPSSPSERRPVS